MQENYLTYAQTKANKTRNMGQRPTFSHQATQVRL